MICPKCESEMKELETDAFSAMKCAGCEGIWFRGGSHEWARNIEGAANFDSDSGPDQEALNEIRDIECPECRQKMIKMIDREQLHIEFEACTYCNGVFFDAGEFRDLTDFSLFERLKQAMSTARSNLNG